MSSIRWQSKKAGVVSATGRTALNENAVAGVRLYLRIGSGVVVAATRVQLFEIGSPSCSSQ
jgi:hypothetical protein